MNTDKPMYGLWISNTGWLKGRNEDAISFDDILFAQEVAGIIHAKVRRIDDSWKDLELFYLEQERKGKSRWHILQTFFKLSSSK